MQFTTVALTTLLSATALALPQTTVHPGQTSSWQVGNYAEGCSPGGCTYSFNISSTDTNPDFGGAFSTSCKGTRSTEIPTTNCTNTEFSSSSKVGTNGSALYVTRTFAFGDETDIAGGNVTTAAPGVVPGSTFKINARVFGQLAK